MTYPPGSFLDILPPTAARRLNEIGHRRRIRRGTIVFHEGGRSRDAFVILEGRIKIATTTPDGREIVLAVRGPGDIVGELSAIDGSPRSATGTAIDIVEANVVPADAFVEFLGNVPGAGLVVLRLLIDRQRESDRARVEFGAYDATRRVARRLVELAERFGQPVGDVIRIGLPLTQEELAGWTGASREAVSKALRALRASALVETGRRAVTVLDVEGLRRRADGV